MKPTTTNKHWIGPLRGAHVSVVLTRMDEHVLRVYPGVITSPYLAVIELDDEHSLRVELGPFSEGTTWCHDWEGESVDALRAAAVLS